jgi:hypothetical protein
MSWAPSRTWFPERKIEKQDVGNGLTRSTGDLEATLNEVAILLRDAPSVPQSKFIAEFSDSAYIVGDRFAAVAAAGIMLMRRALRHEYPLRGGIGAGTFSHQTSGVRTGPEQLVNRIEPSAAGAVINL